MYDALDVAQYAIGYEASQRRSVSNLRLQKLLYFIQAQFLVSNGRPCFHDDIEAWDFGPVVPRVYHEYKVFGSSSIPLPIRTGNYGILPDDRALINRMLDKCAQYSTTTLVSMTHNQKPWRDAYRRRFDNTITNQDMLAFFGG